MYLLFISLLTHMLDFIQLKQKPLQNHSAKIKIPIFKNFHIYNK